MKQQCKLVSSPKVQRLPFTHNALSGLAFQQNMTEVSSSHQVKPSIKPKNSQTTIFHNIQQSQSQIEQTLSQANVQLIKNKSSLSDISSKLIPKHHSHNQSFKGDLTKQTTFQAKKGISMGQEDNFRLLTPNQRIQETKRSTPKEDLNYQLQAHFKNQGSSPNLNYRDQVMKPVVFIPTEFNSLQSSSQKFHQTTGSMNFNSVPQQIRNLTKKADHALIQRTPQKFVLSAEHNKSKSVVDSKENDCHRSNIKANEIKQNVKTPKKPNQKYQSIQLSQQINQTLNSQIHYNNYATNTLIQDQKAVRMCLAHESKIAKYFNELDGQYYCSNCAVKLAQSVGDKIKEVRQSNVKFNVNRQQNQQLFTKTYQQIDAQSLKEEQMKEFSNRIQREQNKINLIIQSSEQRKGLLHILQQQKDAVTRYYDGQINQCECLNGYLIDLIEQQTQSTIQRIATQMKQCVTEIDQWQRVLNDQIKESQQMDQDINNNWDEILRQLSIQDFENTMLYYQQTLKKLNDSLVILQSRQIVMQSLPQGTNQKLPFLIQENFEITESTIPLIASEYDKFNPFLETNQTSDLEEPCFGQIIKTQPTPPKLQQIPTTRLKTDIDHSNPQNSNFFQNFFDRQAPNNFESEIHNLNESKESCRAIASNSLHNNQIYVSFENRDVFNNAMEQHRVNDTLNELVGEEDEELEEEQVQEITTKEQNSTPLMVLHSYHGSQQFDESKEVSVHSTPHSPASGYKTQYERVTTTQLKQQPQEIQPAVQHKQTFRTLFETKPDEEDEDLLVAQPENKKSFQKVNSNASKALQLFQNILPANGKGSSPRYQITVKDSRFDEDQQKIIRFTIQSSSKKNQGSQQKSKLSEPSESSQSSSQKQKIDPFQKNLFSSPTFKNDILELEAQQRII